MREAVVTLASRGCTSLVQLGDFGVVWRGTRSEIQALEALNKQLALHVDTLSRNGSGGPLGGIGI